MLDPSGDLIELNGSRLPLISDLAFAARVTNLGAMGVGRLDLHSIFTLEVMAGAAAMSSVHTVFDHREHGYHQHHDHQTQQHDEQQQKCRGLNTRGQAAAKDNG